MSHPRNLPTLYFWGLLFVTLSLLAMGLGLSLASSRSWLEALWHLCRARWENLGLLWPLSIPLITGIVLIRGGISLIGQMRATRRFERTFRPLRQPPPAHLRPLFQANGLAATDIIFLDLPKPYAFCTGLWQPRIWLTAGLVDLLSEAELAAVLAHEAEHRRRRDPLRLMISRALQAAFFFLPAVGDLARATELQQEIVADQAAVTRLGDNLPLLCAIQKLLNQDTPRLDKTAAVYSPFNITEARLRRLLASPAPIRWRRRLAKWGLNLSIMALLAVVALQATRPITSAETVACTPNPTPLDYSPVIWLSYDSTEVAQVGQ